MSADVSAEATEGVTARNPVCVVSSIIFRDDTEKEILLGVRQSSPSSPRHPGVLSTPTMRIPARLYPALAVDDPPDQPGGTLLSWRTAVPIGAPRTLAEPSSFALEALLTRKLGLADALTMGSFSGEASLAAVSLDVVDDPHGEDAAEWTLMLSYRIIPNKGVDLIPKYTKAYSPLIWGPAERLAASYFGHDALVMDESLDPFEVCIAGLCIRSAVEVIGSDH